MRTLWPSSSESAELDSGVITITATRANAGVPALPDERLISYCSLNVAMALEWPYRSSASTQRIHFPVVKLLPIRFARNVGYTTKGDQRAFCSMMYRQPY